MCDTMKRLQDQEASPVSHAVAYSGWLATKNRENDARKRYMPGAHHKPVIVVVDDEFHIAITLSEILQRRDYRAIWFTDPISALTFMETHEPDLILTDFSMPLLDGVELAGRVKQIYPTCPVLLVSALGNDAQLRRRMLISRLVVEVESKPLPIDRLLLRVAALLSSGKTSPLPGDTANADVQSAIESNQSALPGVVSF